ncbi:MAG: glycosyl hydrolase [Bacteroidota bacterium]
MDHQLLVGTSKGLLIYGLLNEKWVCVGRHFIGFPVSMIHINPYNNDWWVGLSHRHWGQKLEYSSDQGKTWNRKSIPTYPSNALLSNGKPAKLKKIWVMASGANEDELWMGTEPGGLFYSNTNGESFHLVEGLWNHPSRMNANQWFGAGRDHPFIHSICINPNDPNHLYIAVSCAGIFESTDKGKSWEVRNQGLIATYLPNPNAELGHDPHRLLMCQGHPKVLWQQNHCGIFRSTNGGREWKLLSKESEIPHYGFGLAIDHHHPEIAWVIPAKSDQMRVAPDLALTIYQTTNGGANWKKKYNGLPQENCFDIVFRHAFCKKEEHLFFGTNNGNLYHSKDQGTNWTLLSNNLARIEYLEII